MPFDNLSPDPNDAYLADGLTEELIADLSRVKALRVIARNSSTAAHQRTKDLKEISRMLDVRYLLEGADRFCDHTCSSAEGSDPTPCALAQARNSPGSGASRAPIRDLLRRAGCRHSVAGFVVLHCAGCNAGFTNDQWL